MNVIFLPNGRGKARNAPNPAYPNGFAVVVPGDGPRCSVEFPYPAPECGMWLVKCEECDRSFLFTAAGRPDDPISATWPCMKRAQCEP